MKAILLYDSKDSEGVAAKDALCAVQGVDWVPLDASQKIAPCIGCFGCWVKTPGFCVLPRDGGTEYYEEMFDADYVVYVSRVTWGGLSAPVKLYTDRLLPLLLPDFRIVNGEMHHKQRYGRMPEFLDLGFAPRNEGERETFRRYSEAKRDQNGLPRGRGCLILDASPAGEASRGQIAEWFKKEAGL